MDIDHNSIVVSQVMENTSFLALTQNSQKIPKNSNDNLIYLNRHLKQEMTQYDSPIPMFQVGAMYINSGNDLNSFPKTQKPMSTESNGINELPLPLLAHLVNPGNSSRQSTLSESENAYFTSANEAMKCGSHSSSKKPISDQSANLSGLGCFFDLPDASEFEPINALRCKAGKVIESSDDENDEMY
jgi:hypothetical protein